MVNIDFGSIDFGKIIIALRAFMYRVLFHIFQAIHFLISMDSTMHMIALSKYLLNEKKRGGFIYLYEGDEININEIFNRKNVKNNNIY